MHTHICARDKNPDLPQQGCDLLTARLQMSAQCFDYAKGMEAWTQGFCVGICTSSRLHECRRRRWPHRARLERAALRTPSPTPRVSASEDETTGRLGRTRRGISNKKLIWFECVWADELYNNRIQRAVDAALEAKAVMRIAFSRALTRVVAQDEELRKDFNALWAGAKRLR